VRGLSNEPRCWYNKAYKGIHRERKRERERERID
jgi:hypothetical protein